MKYNKLKNIKKSKIIIITIITIIFITANITYAENTWKIKEIENTSIIGNINYISMKLDSKDKPHICYIDQSNELNKNYSFFYLHWNGTNWIKEIIDINDNVGFYCSIDVDADDKPHISYYDQLNGDLKYAKKTGDTWDIQTIDSQGDTGYYSSIIIDNNNDPHISYYDWTKPYGLNYAYYNETKNWSTKTIDSGYSVGLDTSIDVDSNNNPRISYFDHFHNNKSLRYAYKENNNWFFSSVDYDEEVGYGSSLKIDSKNIPHISYHDTTNNKIKYATLTDGEWITQTIDENSGETSRESSLSLDTNNNPHIVYIIIENEKTIKYAHWTGYKWEIQTIGEGAIPDIDLTKNNIPYIIYKDTTKKILKEVKTLLTITTPQSGETWYKGDIYDITWKTEEPDDYIKIELITDENIYSLLEENYSNTGIYSWNITEEIPSNQYTIKITNTNNTKIYASTIINIEEKKIPNESIISPITIIIILLILIIIIVIIILYKMKNKKK